MKQRNKHVNNKAINKYLLGNKHKKIKGISKKTLGNKNYK